MEKLKLLHTFKAYHRILRQILFKYKISNQSDKNKDAMFKTPQYSARRQALLVYILILKGFGYGLDDDDDRSCSTRDL